MKLNHSQVWQESYLTASFLFKNYNFVGIRKVHALS
jgi:hypothetical protein